MPDRDEQFQQSLSDLVNALQTAAPLATRQRRILGDLAQDAVSLEAAVERAARIVLQMRSHSTDDQGSL
jgi:hypothetical protein